MNIIISKKRLISVALMIILVVAAAFSAAAETSSTTSGSNSSISLSDVDSILESIRATDNPSDITKKLDDLINKANLTGNADLKQYAEYAKQAYELKMQLNSVNESINALISKNGNLESINSEIQKAAQLNASYDDMSGIFSQSADSILKELDETSFGKVRDSLSQIKGINEMISNPALASEYDRSLIDILMLNEAINQELLDDASISKAKAAINSSLLVLVSHERSKYSSDEYSKLATSSIEFGKRGNKTKAIAPTNIVMLNQGFKLKNAAICYDDTVMIAIDDVLQFINGKMQYTSGTSTMAIVTKDKLVEFTVGKSDAYVNDKALSTNAPVLSYNGIAYLPVEFVAKAFDIAYISIPDVSAIVLYSNLDQTKN